MIAGRVKKQYIGAIDDEAEAATIYDWHAIISHGLKVSGYILSISSKDPLIRFIK